MIKRKIWRGVICLLLMFGFLLFSKGSAQAEGRETGCELTIIYEYELQPLDPVTVHICRVAELDRETRGFTPLPDYAALCTPDALAKISIAAENAALAEKLLVLAETQGLSVYAEAVTTDGKISFPNVADGLYLLESFCPEGFTAETTLICLPQGTQDAAVWEGQVTVYAKLARGNNPVEPVIRFDPPVEKCVQTKNGTAPTDSRFTFQMTPGEKDYPMPLNPQASIDESTGAMTIQKCGSGSVEFGWVYLDSSDAGKTYSYTFNEQKGSDDRYTYDSMTYTMTLTVTEENGELQYTVLYTDQSGKPVDTMVFTNIFTGDGKTPPVRTGDSAPLALYTLLFFGSAAVLGAGIFSLRKKENKT